MSGAEKRKLASKEKEQKNTETISKTRQISEFLIKYPNSTNSSEASLKLLKLATHKQVPKQRMTCIIIICYNIGNVGN